MFANTTYHQKLDDLISDLPAKCNPAKMGKIRQNKKLNKKNGIVWIKKRACRRWLGGVIQQKWGWPASKYQNWQSKSATAHPRGQGSRSERNGWIEKENTLASQGWSLDAGEKDMIKHCFFFRSDHSWYDCIISIISALVVLGLFLSRYYLYHTWE